MIPDLTWLSDYVPLENFDVMYKDTIVASTVKEVEFQPGIRSVDIVGTLDELAVRHASLGPSSYIIDVIKREDVRAERKISDGFFWYV